MALLCRSSEAPGDNEWDLLLRNASATHRDPSLLNGLIERHAIIDVSSNTSTVRSETAILTPPQVNERKGLNTLQR
jgi:hypothetical protein